MRVAAALLLTCSASGFAPPRSPLLSAPLLRNAAVRKFAPVAVASADDAPPADTSPLPPSAASPSGVDTRRTINDGLRREQIRRGAPRPTSPHGLSTDPRRRSQTLPTF